MSYNDDLNSLIGLHGELQAKQSRRFASDYAAIDYDNTYSAYQRIAEKHGDDKNFMIEAAKIDVNLIRQADDNLKRNPEFVKAILEIYPDEKLYNYGIPAEVIEQAKNPVVEEEAPVVEEEQQPIEVTPEGPVVEEPIVEPVVEEPIVEPVPETPAPVEEPTPTETVVEETKEVEEDSVAINNYRASGYGQNTEGYYFNPNTDEYDPNYNPSNDSLFNPKVRTALTEGMSDEELLTRLIESHNSLASTINEYPYIGIENVNIRDDKYSLSAEAIKEFNDNSRFVKEVKNVAPEVYETYNGLLNQLQTYRNKMAEVLNKPSYPGIENENIDEFINVVSNQLDDWEIDQLNENKQKIMNMKEQYPGLFASSVVKIESTPTEEEPTEAPVEPESTEAPVEPEPTEAPVEPEPTEEEPTPVEETPTEPVPEEPTVEPVEEEMTMPTLSKPIEEYEAEYNNKRKEILRCALCGAAGIATGIGVGMAVTTFAPGVGAFLVPASIVKLSMTFGSKGINLYCKKHPDGKFTKFVDKQKAKDHARVEKFEETNIGKKVKVVKNFLNKKEVKWALNGFAMGYLGYNVFHVIHGFTTTTRIGTMNPENSYDPTIRGRVHPTINSSPADVSNTVAETVNNTVTETAETVANTTSSVEQAIEAGQVVDVSSISKGFVSSTAPEPVQLLQSAGKHVVLDQQVVLENGQEMWHMMQTDANGVSIGKGLGWFTKEDVINAAQNLTQSGMSR